MANQSVLSTQVSEESLIQAGQHGDAQALNTLFHRHQRTLFHSALGIMGNPQDAEDALQDGLLSAFRNLKSFEGRSQFSVQAPRRRNQSARMKSLSLSVWCPRA
jgi:RNA polymerase sigma-70 factor (ECF subfamily)